MPSWHYDCLKRSAQTAYCARCRLLASLWIRNRATWGCLERMFSQILSPLMFWKLRSFWLWREAVNAMSWFLVVVTGAYTVWKASAGPISLFKAFFKSEGCGCSSRWLWAVGNLPDQNLQSLLHSLWLHSQPTNRNKHQFESNVTSLGWHGIFGKVCWITLSTVFSGPNNSGA